LSIDFRRPAWAFKGDEATYYSLAHSLARDGDFTFERKDLVRVWEEYSGGPEGIFLKRGKKIRLHRSDRFPYVRWDKLEDPVRTRLYYSKSFIYPLAAAPFVFVFGTERVPGAARAVALPEPAGGLHVHRRAGEYATRRPRLRGGVSRRLGGAGLFRLAHPELFNLSLAMWAMFLWSYKEVTPARGFLGSAGSDYLAAALVGVLTFSKPPHAILMFPLVALLVFRRKWRRRLLTGVVWAAVAGGLFLANAAITGEFNYQGGDRKTFYGRDGFPFANERETFENIGPVRGRESIMVGHVLVNPHTGTVFVSNVVYFLVGRFCGLLPYFFPGVLSAVLFLTWKREPWQWLTAATIVAAALVLIVLTPFTYSGGGGPVGNRYFLSFYPLFLFLTPPLAGMGAAARHLESVRCSRRRFCSTRSTPRSTQASTRRPDRYAGCRSN
jgi:hypothetical protein